MANSRVYYAIHGVVVGNVGELDVLSPDTDSGSSDPDKLSFVHGAQSADIETSFNLQEVFELGQLSLYQNIEDIPDVTVNVERVIDGYPLLYHLATPKATNPSLTGRSTLTDQTDIRMLIVDDAATALNTNATAVAEVYCSGMYVSSLSYSMSVDDNMTESVSFVGQNKLWAAGGDAQVVSDDLLASSHLGTDSPNWTDAQGGSDRILRRQDFLLGAAGSSTLLPIDLPIYDGAKLTDAVNHQYSFPLDADSPELHIQSVNISVDLGRTPINELGRKAPFTRTPDLPTEVTCEIELLSQSGDWVQVYENGFPTADADRGISAGDNLGDRRIEIWLADGTIFNLGEKNKLQSVTHGGGDTGGGNATMTFSYSNFNDLEILHSGDPAGFTRYDSTDANFSGTP